MTIPVSQTLKNMRAIGGVIVLSLMLSSCATGPGPYPVCPPQPAIPHAPAPAVRSDICHVVGPGETLWRLGKMYDVPIDTIMRANGLKRADTLRMGQHLIIPRAAPMKAVIPLYKNTRWKYIIVHHSVTDEGNALSLRGIHLARGFDGIGYDFIIDNGTCGKADGQIEASPRWLKQQDGAHCKASGMNKKGIGICLVGNFSKEKVSAKQMDSLIYLVKTLQSYYRIPNGNVLGHGQVPGARTECPGTRFPWAEFRRRLAD